MRCFSSPGLPRTTMDSPCDDPQGVGFPHSEIRGSTVARTFPRLIAACYVLHRLSVPRHPPDALRRLFFEAATRRVKPRARELAKTQHTQPQTSLSAGRSCRLGQNFFTMSKSVKLLTISYQLSTDNPGHQPGQTLLPFPSAPASPPPPAFRPWLSADRLHGGAERNRTVDLLLAKQALSQLSYSPVSESRDPPTRNQVSDGVVAVELALD